MKIKGCERKLTQNRTNITNGTLLEELVKRTGCLYLSDLRQEKWKMVISLLLPQIAPEAYSLQQWTETIRYLLEERKNFHSADEAKKYLSDHLTMKKNI